MPLVFLISIGISFLSVSIAIYSWVLLIIADAIALHALGRHSW